MIKPLFNSVLIEVVNEYDGILGATTDNVQKGVLRDYDLIRDHLTASTGYGIIEDPNYEAQLHNMLGKTVYWQEYADAGAKFRIDDKDYVLVPFYRLIGFEE
jgi:hypothetical protein